MSQKSQPFTKEQAKSVLKSVLGVEDNTGNNSDVHRIVEELLSDNNIEGKTDLNSNQIVAFSRAAWYAERYDSEAMRIVIRYLEKFLQSKDRKGRLELTGAITNLFRYQLEQDKAEKVEI